MEFQLVKVVVFVPLTHSDKIRKIMAESGAGNIGNYDYCTFSSLGTGRFRGKDGTNPYVGEAGKIEKVEEERIETICPFKSLGNILKNIKQVHPYEEPVVDIYPLLNQL